MGRYKEFWENTDNSLSHKQRVHVRIYFALWAWRHELLKRWVRMNYVTPEKILDHGIQGIF